MSSGTHEDRTEPRPRSSPKGFAVPSMLGSLLAAALGVSAGFATPRENVESLVRNAEDLAHFEAFAPAAAKLETALREAERLGDPALTALCLDRMGLVLDFEGDSLAGSERHARALALAREIGDAPLEASILASIGLGDFRRSDYGAPLASLGEALSPAGADSETTPAACALSTSSGACTSRRRTTVERGSPTSSR